MQLDKLQLVGGSVLAYLTFLCSIRNNLAAPRTVSTRTDIKCFIVVCIGICIPRSLVDLGILADKPEVRRLQQKMGMPFMYARQASNYLHVGLQCQVNPLITMFVTPQSRHLWPSQAPYSHLLQKALLLGAAGSTKSESMSLKEITALLAEEVKAIVKGNEVNTSTQLLSLGLDSFGFVSG